MTVGLIAGTMTALPLSSKTIELPASWAHEEKASATVIARAARAAVISEVFMVVLVSALFVGCPAEKSNRVVDGLPCQPRHAEALHRIEEDLVGLSAGEIPEGAVRRFVVEVIVDYCCRKISAVRAENRPEQLRDGRTIGDESCWHRDRAPRRVQESVIASKSK
jgi:hypothetical protein